MGGCGVEAVVFVVLVAEPSAAECGGGTGGFGEALEKAALELLDGLSVVGVVDEIVEFVGVVDGVVEFVGFAVEIGDKAELFGGDGFAESVFGEGIGADGLGFVVEEWEHAAALEGFRNVQPGQFTEGGEYVDGFDYLGAYGV